MGKEGTLWNDLTKEDQSYIDGACRAGINLYLKFNHQYSSLLLNWLYGLATGGIVICLTTTTNILENHTYKPVVPFVIALFLAILFAAVEWNRGRAGMLIIQKEFGRLQREEVSYEEFDLNEPCWWFWVSFILVLSGYLSFFAGTLFLAYIELAEMAPPPL